MLISEATVSDLEGRIAAEIHSVTGDAGSREICPGGVGFETRSARGDVARSWVQI